MDTSKFDDAYFKPTEKKEKGKGEKEFFGKVLAGCLEPPAAPHLHSA